MHLRLKTGAAVTITIVLTMFSTVTMVEAEDEAPPATGSSAPPVTMTVVVDPDPDVQTERQDTTATPDPGPEVTSAPVVSEAPTTIVTESTSATESPSTSNPNQVDQAQTAVVSGTVVANANTGGNEQHTEQPAQGGSQQPANVDTGNATAVGSDDENIVSQGADITLMDQAVANLLQIALILNVGAALANSGLNTVESAAGGSGASAAIGTGSADATGLDIDQYITQAARETGDADTDAHATQVALSLWMGLALADSGTNAVTGTGVAGSGGTVQSGRASATGNDSSTDISQYASVLGTDQSRLDVTQRATVLNVGFALANSGLNDVAGAAGGLLSASPDDDNEHAQELFAMLLPALLQSYGYGPGQGSITSGNATAVGNESETFVKQVAFAAASGDGIVEIVQDVLVANMGAAGANTGANTIGSVRTLDPDTAEAVVTMAAFMAELLALVHQSTSSAVMAAQSQGIEIPFGDLILQLDGSFDGLDTVVSEGGARANIRQVSIVVSLGITEANTGGNTTVSNSRSAQGGRVNALSAGDAVAVLALDADGNVISSGGAAAGSEQLVVICQRLNADDVACLVPPEPTTTTIATTSTTSPTITAEWAGVLGQASSAAPSVPAVAGARAQPGTPSGVRMASAPGAGPLPATGGDIGAVLAGAAALVIMGAVLLLVRRKRPVY